MVAITVILAAVIGAFVLEIGDQQETAPNTSFDTNEEREFWTSGYDSSSGLGCSRGNGHGCWNVSPVQFSHAGGDTINYRNARLAVNGNKSVYTLLDETAGPTEYAHVVPQPDVREYFGTNKRVEMDSGETWEAGMFCGEVCKTEGDSWGSGNPDNYVGDKTVAQPPPHDQVPFNEVTHFRTYENREPSAGGKNAWDVLARYSYSKFALMDPLREGDEVQMVWMASSGGKTQTLTKYTVQTGVEDRFDSMGSA
jgi:hypothetical protein